MKQYRFSDVFCSETNYLWILKPADWNQGQGVFVFTRIQELEDLLFKFYKGWHAKPYSSIEVEISKSIIYFASPLRKPNLLPKGRSKWQFQSPVYRSP